MRAGECVRSSTWLFASVRSQGGEGSRGDISSAVWLSQFPREAASRTMQTKKNHRTTDNWNATKKGQLFIGDWIIAVARDWRQGKCVSDCTVLVADTYHLLDSSTHPSPSTAHNSRNTLNKSESGGKGTQDKYCVSIFPPSPFQLSLTLTDEQWEYFELCCVLSFASGFRTVLSKPDVLWQRLIDLLFGRHVFPLFFQEGFGFSQLFQTLCSCVILTPVNSVQTHKISIQLPLDHKVWL